MHALNDNGPARGARTQAGFSLLEVLIALVVLSVGLLGLAAMQVRGLAYNHEAHVRSQATMLAYDMMDRMRMRKLNGLSQAAINADMALYESTSKLDNSDASCARSAAPADEVVCWQQDLAAALPATPDGQAQGEIDWVGGRGTASLSDDRFQIVIRWGSRAEGPEAQKSQVWTFDL